METQIITDSLIADGVKNFRISCTMPHVYMVEYGLVCCYYVMRDNRIVDVQFD